MVFKNQKIQKFVSGLLVISILAPSIILLFQPTRVNAMAPVDEVASTSGFLSNALEFIGNLFTESTSVSSATTAGYGIKEWAQYILRLTLQAIARKAIAQITRSTVNWINNGFHGSPLFVENPQSFFKDIAKSEVKNLITQLGYDRVKFPFGRDFALNTISAYKSTLDSNSSYTLSKVSNDPVYLANYRNNFSVGGWNGFLMNTQYPQNNYIGFQMIATDELAKKIDGAIQTPVQVVNKVLQEGQGFLSPQTCPSNTGLSARSNTNPYTPPVFDEYAYDQTHDIKKECPSTLGEAEYDSCVAKWNDAHNVEKREFTRNNSCPGGWVNTTPGTVVADQIKNAMGTQLRQSELGAAMGNSLSAIFDALINQLLNKGLSALASKKNPEPEPDTWTYDGPGTGLEDTGSDSDWSTTADQEIILKDFKALLNGKFIGACTIRGGSGDLTEEGVLSEATITDITEDDCANASGIWISRGTYIPGDIERTEAEIRMMDNPACDKNDAENCPKVYRGGELVVDSQGEPLLKENTIQKRVAGSLNTNYPENSTTYVPGILQQIDKIWDKTQVLDQCVPGPDKGWEERLKGEQERVSKPLTQAEGYSTEELDEDEVKDAQQKAKASHDIIRELKFSVDSFTDWLGNKMMLSLPSAIIYLDEINSVDDLPQLDKETVDAARAKRQTLARLKAIRALLDSIPGDDQPAKGSANEAKMITARKQYDAIRSSISSQQSVENTNSTLQTLNDKLKKLHSPTLPDPKNSTLDPTSIAYAQQRKTHLLSGTGLVKDCLVERASKGWSDPDLSGKGQAILSSAKGKQITRRVELTNTEGDTIGGMPSLAVGIGAFLLGGIVGAIIFGEATKVKITDLIKDVPIITTGSEVEQFCKIPIISGYSHGEIIRADNSNRGQAQAFTFRNLQNERGSVDKDTQGNIISSFQDLPMVNAQDVYGDITCTGLCSWPGGTQLVKPKDERTSITIDCNTVFKANKIDYTHAGDPNF